MARTKRAERPEPTKGRRTRTRAEAVADAAPAVAELVREHRRRKAEQAKSDRRAS